MTRNEYYKKCEEANTRLKAFLKDNLKDKLNVERLGNCSASVTVSIPKEIMIVGGEYNEVTGTAQDIADRFTDKIMEILNLTDYRPGGNGPILCSGKIHYHFISKINKITVK